MSKKVLVSHEDVKQTQEIKASVKIIEVQKELEELRNAEEQQNSVDVNQDDRQQAQAEEDKALEDEDQVVTIKDLCKIGKKTDIKRESKRE